MVFGLFIVAYEKNGEIAMDTVFFSRFVLTHHPDYFNDIGGARFEPY